MPISWEKRVVPLVIAVLYRMRTAPGGLFELRLPARRFGFVN